MNIVEFKLNQNENRSFQVRSCFEKSLFVFLIMSLMFAASLLTGCSETDTDSQLIEPDSSSITPITRQDEAALWLRRCAGKIAANQGTQYLWFNGIGANDVLCLPKDNPVDEIFSKCISIESLSADKEQEYKQRLTESISQMRSVTAGMTREQVNQLLNQDGGIKTPSADTFLNKGCGVLKIRVEFAASKDEQGRLKFGGEDKVKAVSMPYLGLQLLKWPVNTVSN